MGNINLPRGWFKICFCAKDFKEERKNAPLHLTFTLYREEEDFAFQTLGHGDEMHLTAFSSSNAVSLFDTYPTQALKMALQRDDNRFYCLRHCEC